jgi:hypothetical protein
MGIKREFIRKESTKFVFICDQCGFDTVKNYEGNIESPDPFDFPSSWTQLHHNTLLCNRCSTCRQLPSEHLLDRYSIDRQEQAEGWIWRPYYMEILRRLKSYKEV